MMAAESYNRRTIAAHEFHKARRKAAIEDLVARVSGQSAALLSYEEIVAALGLRGQSSGGLQQVPVAAIVGSVGRYNDFSRSFLPLRDTDQDRWVGVKTAAPHIGDLPPVELYQINDFYFVLDGNHRVSIARQQELEYLDAYVTTVYTRVPLPPGADPDAMIVAAEYAAFLEWTKLDQLRPDSDLRVSVPGQYGHLENHIEAFRYIIETNESREIDTTAAASRWYDEAYLPLVESIREYGILHYFPGRTETDFFIWLAAHRAELTSELGVPLTPDATVSHLASLVTAPVIDDTNRSLFGRARKRLTRLVATDPDKVQMQQSWIEERTLARYSDHLFADILLPVDLVSGDVSPVALQQAMALAIQDGARLCVLGILPNGEDATASGAVSQLETAVRTQVDAIELENIIVIDTGDLVSVIARFARLYDLIVVDRALASTQVNEQASVLAAILADIRRPVLVTGTAGEPPVYSRVTVAIDQTIQSREGLFIAAYLAEQWGLALSVLPLDSGPAQDAAIAYARDYLSIHEVEIEVVNTTFQATPDRIAEFAQDRNCGLLIIPGIASGRRSQEWSQNLEDIIADWPHSLLIAN